MNSSLAAAWLAGEGIVIWRMVHKDHRPPVPGALLGITALFLTLGLVAEVFPASAKFVGVAAWGLDVAAFLNALPAGLAGQISQAQAAESAAVGGGTTQAPGTSTAGGRG